MRLAIIPGPQKRGTGGTPADYELVGVGGAEEELPRGVKVEPALGAEPAGGQSGDVEQGVAAGADKFGAIPGEEGSAGEANGGGVGDAMEADGAAPSLIEESPAESQEAERKGGNELEVLCGNGVAGGAAVGEVERGEVDGRQDDGDFGGKEGPAEERTGARGFVIAEVVFAEGDGGDCGQREKCDEYGEEVHLPRALRAFAKGDAVELDVVFVAVQGGNGDAPSESPASAHGVEVRDQIAGSGGWFAGFEKP